MTGHECPVKKPGQPSRTRSSEAAEGAVQGALSSWLLLLDSGHPALRPSGQLRCSQPLPAAAWASKEEVTRAAAAARNPRRRRDKAARNATIKRGRYWMTRFARPFGAALRAFFALRARPACAGMTSRADPGLRRGDEQSGSGQRRSDENAAPPPYKNY